MPSVNPSGRRLVFVAHLAAAPSGIPRYASSVLRALDGLAPWGTEEPPLVLTTSLGAANLGLRAMEVARAPLGLEGHSGPKRLLADWMAPLRRSRIRLHYFDVVGPLLAPRVPFSVTFHDANFVRNPRNFNRLAAAQKRLTAGWLLRHATHVVTLGRFAAGEAREVFHVGEHKLSPIGSGPGLPLVSGPPLRRQGAILYVGGFASTKSVPTLVRAHATMARDVPLWLVGRRGGSGLGEVERAIADSPKRHLVRLLHDVPDRELDILYRTASLFAFPSRYEGWGLPVLEAMTRGCPVVCSSLPAVGELVGDAAMTVPDWSTARWAHVLDAQLESPKDLARLGEAGIARAREFTWERTAERLWSVLQLPAGATHWAPAAGQ